MSSDQRADAEHDDCAAPSTGSNRSPISSMVVSLVSREITSPVRVTSKNPGDSVSR